MTKSCYNMIFFTLIIKESHKKMVKKGNIIATDSPPNFLLYKKVNVYLLHLYWKKPNQTNNKNR